MEKKQQSGAKARSGKADASGIGGREFGNVIEPTQAQMASGNKGLTAEPGAAKEDKGTKPRTGSRKKAA